MPFAWNRDTRSIAICRTVCRPPRLRLACRRARLGRRDQGGGAAEARFDPAALGALIAEEYVEVPPVGEGRLA